MNFSQLGFFKPHYKSYTQYIWPFHLLRLLQDYLCVTILITYLFLENITY